MKKLILIITLLLTVSLSAQVTRYVNKNATGGVYDGTTWTRGWRTFADINWGALTAGSTLYISGGTDSIVYYEALTPQCFGTANNRIMITTGKYSPLPSGHSGRVIIDGGGARGHFTGSNNTTGIMTDANAHFRVNALIGGQIWNSTDNHTYGTITSNTETTVTANLTDCKFGCTTEERDWDTGDVYYITFRDYSIGFLDVVGGSTAPCYTTVKGFECRNGWSGVAMNTDMYRPQTRYGRGIQVDSCKITDFYDLAGVLVKGCFDSSIVSRNYILGPSFGGYQTDGLHYNGVAPRYPVFNIVHDNIILAMSQDPKSHTDAIQSVLADGWIIYNNIVMNDSVNSPEGGGMPFILSSTDLDYNDYPPVIIFNNFLWMGGAWWPAANAGAVFRSRHDGIGEDAGAQSPNMVFNNTIVCAGPRIAVIDQEWTIRLMVNNIFASYCRDSHYWGGDHGWYANVQGGCVYTPQSEIDSFRTNVWWRQDSLGTADLHAGSWKKAGTPVSIGSWADWVSNGGTGLFRDPKFVSSFGSTADHLSLVPDVKVGSPVIGAGENINYLYNYIKNTLGFTEAAEAIKYDIYGTARDLDNPSIGAYEYYAAGWTPPDTIPSFSFTSVTGAELNTEYIGKARFPSTSVDSTFHVWTTTSASFKINYNGTYSTAMKEAEPDDTVYVKNQSDATRYLFMTTETIYAGNVVTGQNFNVTTKADPGGGGVVNGGWLGGSNGRKIYLKNGHALITRQP